MTEPEPIAPDAEAVTDGIWHWRIHNPAIGDAISSSHAVEYVDEEGAAACVLIDPVRLDPHALQQLPPVRAIVLTADGHQRAAWRYRQQFGAEVWLPEGAQDTQEEPDHRYGDGASLPGGLVAVHTPGPEQAHYSLHDSTRRALFVSDLVARSDDGELSVLPAEYHDDPEATRASIGRLAGLDFDYLLLDHGAPVTSGARDVLAATLA